MTGLRTLWARLAGRARCRDGDLDEELQLHLDLLTEEHLRGGLPLDEARLAARRSFGGVAQAREAYRAQRGWQSLDALAQDIRYALRGFRRAPGFTLVAVLVLAIGIGATTSIFTLINALLLRELPVPEPAELVDVSVAGDDGLARPLSVAAFREISRRSGSFAQVIGWDGNGVVTAGHGSQLTVANFWAVSGNFYSALGQTPLVGRLLSEADVAAAAPVAVIGHEFWQRFFRGDPSIVGRELRIERGLFTIVGVTRPYFTGLWVGSPPSLTVPLSARGLVYPGWPASETAAPAQVTGRLAAGVSLEQARAEVDVIWRDLREATLPPSLPGARRDAFLAARPIVESIATGREHFLRPRFARPLYMLLGVAGVMLLITCVHVASLLLARAARREGELSVRAALGAGRGRLVRQALTESLLLAIGGAAVGLLAARWMSGALARMMTQQYLTPAAFDFRPDAPVLAAAIAAALGTCVAFTAAPAWFAARRDPAGVLQRSARGTTGRGGAGGRTLIAIQVALTTVLLAGAGLLTRSLSEAHRLDAGFDADGLLQSQLIRRPEAAAAGDTSEYQRQLVERVTAIPGVQSASLSSHRTGRAETFPEPVSSPMLPAGVLTAGRIPVAPGYFATAGIALVAGRDFSWNDWNSASVAIVNRTLAARLFPDGGAVGGAIRHGDAPGVERFVVGVVEDARLDDVRSEGGVMFVPLGPQRQTSFLHVRASGDSGALRAAIDREVLASGRQYVLRTLTTRAIVDQRLVDVRLAGVVAQFFAGASLVLVCVGLYGVLSYQAAARTREIGLRLALGADRRTVLRQMLREGLVPVAVGAAAGVPLAVAAARTLRTLLFGLEPSDPLTLALMLSALFAAAAAAAYQPARRASRIEPMVALRTD
jgi:predicted permease